MNTLMGDALRKSLDEVDRRHKRTTILTIVLLLMVASVAIATILRVHDLRMTLAYGLAAVLLLIALSTIKVGQISYDNTRRILKAIEMLSRSKED